MSLTVNVRWLVSTNSLRLSYHEPRGQKNTFCVSFSCLNKGKIWCLTSSVQFFRRAWPRWRKKAWFSSRKKRNRFVYSCGQCSCFLFFSWCVWDHFKLGSNTSVHRGGLGAGMRMMKDWFLKQVKYNSRVKKKVESVKKSRNGQNIKKTFGIQFQTRVGSLWKSQMLRKKNEIMVKMLTFLEKVKILT